MLGRAFVPLLRPSGRTLLRRANIVAPASVLLSRSFANGKRPDRFAPSSRQQPQQKASSNNQYSKQQDEFQSPADPSRNTAPSSDNLARNQQRTDPLTSSTQSPGAKEQEEIKGFAERNEEPNTVPDESAPQQPLPDLTQGIPSTLDAELQQARGHQTRSKRADESSVNITEDPTQPEPSHEGPGGPTDGLPKTSYVSSADRKRQAQFKWTYIAMGTIFFGGIVYLGRDWDTSSEESRHQDDAPSGWSVGAFYKRFKARLSDTLSFYNEPAFEKLLPDPHPNPQMRPPFTLVLSLEDLLMHSEWSREHGWRIAKRPGVDYFIRYLSQYYELVIWTSQPSMNADPIIKKLDPYKLIPFPLFREATLYKNGEHIKDLSYLNRDIPKVLMIDTNPGHARNQPENAIILPKWTGDPKDKRLVELIPFLEYAAVLDPGDIRAVLKSFEGKDIPVEFAKRMKIQRDKHEAKYAATQGKKSSFSLVSALGMKSGQSEKPKMLWDQVREQGQKQYEAIDKEIRENGAKWLAEMEAEEKRLMEEAMKSGKGAISGYFGGGSRS